ncbi:MAG: ATP-grasp domain-containing protein [Melioribacteraceae bacterium]|nr:ATP-grasp domain-containing protein [Melioribacteraceae bacterium]
MNSNTSSLFAEIRSFNPDTIFNLIESVEGNAQMESHIAAMFDILEVSYTGNSSLALGNCLFKQQTKRILIGSNIPTPNYEVIKHLERINTIGTNLKFPLIVKLLREDASIGISENSVVKSKEELKNRISYLFKNFKQDLLLEEYIEGRELNVSILDNEVLPISEIDFKGLPENLPKIITYEAKWSPESDYYKHTIPVCPAKLSKRVTNKISNIALRAFKELDCRDYARVDIRLSKDNVPYVIEINPNPDISPDSGFARSATAAGISYNELIDKLITLSIGRYY